jgi:ATP-binding cassette, subfamily C, bacterial CydD
MARRLLALAPGARLALAAAVALGLAGAAATVAQLALLARVVDAAFLGGAGLAELRAPLLLLLGAIALRAALTAAREVAAGAAAARVKLAIRARLVGHLQRLGPAYVAGERTGTLVAVATDGVERLDPYVARYLPQVVLAAAVPLAVLAVALPRDPLSGLLLLLTGPSVVVVLVLVGDFAEGRIRRQWLALTRLKASFLDTLAGLPTLKAHNLAGSERARVARRSEAFRRRALASLRYAFLSGLVLEFMATAAIALIAVQLGVRLLGGHVAFAEAFLVLLLAPEFFRPLRELGAARHAGIEGKVAAGEIFRILDSTPGSGAAATTTPAGSKAMAVPGSTTPPGACQSPSIEFAGVSYTYPGRERPALDNVTLTLPAGSRTALVGPSGAGKSTLAALLLRFAEPGAGMIAVDGAPLAGVSPERWRDRVAYVPQHPHLFAGTARENLLLARPGATTAEVARAAELAGAAGFIARLPRGYDTPLGEGGARLSRGQAQRLALARAFLRDAPLLILDEPTASLDPETEGAVRRALVILARGRTVLVIAHRLNTARDADRIVVLDVGRVVEVGAHAELLAAGGRYAALVGAAGGAGVATA